MNVEKSKKVNKSDKTKLKKENFLTALQRNLGHISRSCESSNISRATYYKWLKDDEEFKESVEASWEGLVDHVEHQLLTKINKGDTTAMIFFLKTKGKDRGYSERQEFEIIKPIEDITFDEI